MKDNIILFSKIFFGLAGIFLIPSIALSLTPLGFGDGLFIVVLLFFAFGLTTKWGTR